MTNVVRVVTIAIVAAAMRGEAQRTVAEPPLSPLSPEAMTALDDLSSRFAGDIALHQGWFRDRAIMYYDFGRVAETAGRVLWPIHGFDARGYPVAIRGQRPIFSTLPGLQGYSGLWQLDYIIVADKVQPNQLRDLAGTDALVKNKRAAIRDAGFTVNLAIVPKGSRLERDSTPSLMGWYEGREVQFFDFGRSGLTPVPLIAFIKGLDSTGAPDFLREQVNIVDTLPVTPPYADMWHVRFARPDSTYVPNTLKGAAAVAATTIPVDPPNSVRNCPVAIVDGARVQRVPSPISMFADLRSLVPPAPTKPQ
ncbi:MAG: hypothetical protein AABZ80_13655 [Gemmatimonadota bacterium]